MFVSDVKKQFRLEYPFNDALSNITHESLVTHFFETI